jgi:hypothetical protein
MDRYQDLKFSNRPFKSYTIFQLLFIDGGKNTYGPGPQLNLIPGTHLFITIRYAHALRLLYAAYP